MPQSKATPKERHFRQRAGRAVRRTLTAITPKNSLPQPQCLLFSMLPAEIRLMIFQLVLSQRYNWKRPIAIDSLSPLYRPGHAHRTTLDARLLRTCRLVYYEAGNIPLRSTTHHFQHLGSTSWLYDGGNRLHHITKQAGMNLYHLHDNLIALKAGQFTKFLLPHLRWRRITWTIRAYLLPPLLAQYREIDDLDYTLRSLVIPESCQEVNLEFETREDLVENWSTLQERASVCQQVTLKRSDSSVLEFDSKYALQYSWTGSGQARWSTSEITLAKSTMTYRTIRLCWRARVPRRDYMSYDHMNCLRVDGVEGVKELKMLK